MKINKRFSLCNRFLIMLLSTYFGMGNIDAYGQQQLLSLNVKNQTVKSVLLEMEKQSDYNFFYDTKLVDTNRKVSLSYNGKDVNAILNDLFGKTDIEYNIINNDIILSSKNIKTSTNSVKQTMKKISGKVIDKSGEAIIGANVLIKGSTNGTITAIDGSYSISDVPLNAILVVSYIGYKSAEVKVSSSSVYNITLEEDSKTLGDVVVTALGIKREEKALGYSVQKINGEAISTVKGTDVATSLSGKIAGLSINNSSEISEKPELKLRGENPLIVIDGVAYGNLTLSDVSADDIENIDVLKGATASALYGVRGRAGAIMITTKKSGKEGTLTVNVSNNTMFSAGYLKFPEAQSSYSTGNHGKLEYYSGYVWGDYMDGHNVEQYDPITMSIKNMPLESKGKNNVKNFLRNSLVTNTNVNVSQSGKLGGFRVSATQIHYDGQYPESSLDKYIVNGNGSINYKKFKLDASFSYKKEMAPNMPTVNYGNGNILYNMLIWGGTEFDIRDFKNYWKVKNQEQNWSFKDWYDNPYYLMNEATDKRDNNLFSASVNMSYDIVKGLKLMFRSGYDNYSNNQEMRKSVGDSRQKRGYFYYGDTDGSSFNNDLILNGQYKIKNFEIDAIAGASTYWYRTTVFYANTRGGLSVPGFYSLNASVERANVSKNEKKKALYSVYGKMGISWKSGIYLDVTGRNDWSSTLPSNSRSYFYPSVSLSILPTSFVNPFDGTLDFLKFRGSWTVAKKDLDVYDINAAYKVTTDVWDGMSTATYPTILRDPNCKPETEDSYEFGTDIRFFNGRLGFDCTYFTRLRHNRLIQAEVSKASGSEKIITNTQEELRQKGMEFTITGKPIVSEKFTWESIANISFWHWYYGKLDPTYSSQDPRIAKGERYDKFFITDFERDNDGNLVLQAGYPVKNKFKSVIGHTDPKCYLGWTNKFTYKNLDLSISIDGRIGGLMYSWTEQAMWHSGAHPDSDNEWRYDEVVNHKTNYIADGVKIVSGSLVCDPFGKVIEDTRKFAKNDVAVSYQDFIQLYNRNPWDDQPRHNIKNASFIKLREVALNYTLPASIAHKILMKNVKLGVIGQNLLMWTKEFKFSDPDRGFENLNTPTSRYFGFNINLTL